MDDDVLTVQKAAPAPGWALPEPFRLKKVTYPELMNEIGTLRIQAWRSEPGVNPLFFAKQQWLDPLDQTAHHWVVLHEDTVVAAARMSFHAALADIPYSERAVSDCVNQYYSKRLASINRLVVSPDFRGKGLAKALDRVRVDFARQQGIDVIMAQPQLNRLESLQKLGFKFICQLASIPEMPERPLFFMVKPLMETA